MIPFLRPNLVKQKDYACYLDEIDNSRIYSNYGPLNKKFESKVLEDYFNNQGSVVTVNNATIGLMLAINQARRKHEKAKFALMPSFTFAATPLAAMWCGLTPYFIDIDPKTWLMDLNQLHDVIKELNDEVAVVIPYATFGVNMSLEPYDNLLNQGIPVVVDAAASFGSHTSDYNFGNDFLGTVVYSFQATKSFGIGEGGLMYSNNPETIAQLRQAGNFGFNQGRESTQLGLNSKMSEYAAAIALATLQQFQTKTTLRQQLYSTYIQFMQEKGLFDIGWATQEFQGFVAHQFFPALCPPNQKNTLIVEHLGQKNIQARTYFAPACHQQQQFENCPFKSLNATNAISGQVISLPLWDEISTEQLASIVEALK